MRPIRRIGIVALAALVAGAAINVGVAWWIAATAKPQVVGQWGTIGGPWLSAAPDGWPELSSAAYGYQDRGWWASGQAFAPDPAGGQGFRMSWFISGWPRPSMQAVWHDRVAPGAVPTSVPPRNRPAATGLFALSGGAPPLTPRWPGFAANTLLYAAIVGVVAGLVMLIGPLRRRRRVRRGLCPRCGYDLAGLETCPECGAPPRSTLATPRAGASDTGGR